jgi:hypothetical protein
VITEKQRRRALARAKWERQQAKRTAAQRRARMWSIIGGAAVSVVVIVFVGWGIHHLVTNNSPTTPVFPINTLTMKTPTDTRVVVSYSPPASSGPTASAGSTSGASPSPAVTTPVSTGATGKAQP